MTKTPSEIIHDALVEVKQARDEMTPGTFSYTLATNVMKELSELEFRTFNQEMNAGVA
jgi:hypothetical protein